MWNTRKFEQHIHQRLLEELGEEPGTSRFATYQLTRAKLLDNIWKEIAGVEPDLSDHGPDHIGNVLDNAHYLLSDNQELHRLNATELYCLGMCILFHDVGNLFGREAHHKKIGEVFDWARGTDAVSRREKTLVLRVAGAHTGLATDGSKDTLRDVPEPDHLHQESVRPRELAAILRFADELAEGPQRTSEYRRRTGLISPESQIFHDYASVTHIRPDRGTERVLLTYELQVDTDGAKPLKSRKKALADLLKFIYQRALKLDQERRYAKFYSSALEPFKATQVVLNFHCRGEILGLDLTPIVLTDKVVPGDPSRAIPEINKQYAVGDLVDRIMQSVSKGPK